MKKSSQFGKWISNPPPGQEVVITGISGRFPDSNNLRQFQDNLFNKKDMVNDDGTRWKLNHPEIPQRTGKIHNIDKLDAGFFGLHYRQADIMDPMTRKFLEVAIEAIFDAGVNPEELQGTRTAVLVGACYADMEIETLSNITKPQSFGVTGYLRSFIANRISYFLKLKGPSCVLDTACSSSLNAFELAFKMIRKGECDQAIVGGVNLLLHPGITRQFFRLGVLSSDGTCKVFDDSANGYVRGETIACIFLQRAKNARRIYAQVVYTKVNCDGFKSSGITFPSTEMQEQLMTEILQESGVDPNELIFMEAHGTGTEVGDPQEVEAIDCAIARKRNKPLLIGSVKCSVGHTEPSSGFCSLAKVLIAMETGLIPPNIHLKKIKRGMLGFEEGRLIPVTEITKLKNEGFIGINNFGFGGNNCHLLLKNFNKLKNKIEDDLPRLVCVSGRTKEAIASLLTDVNRCSLNREYISLIHQVFKQEVKGHVYRGFSVVAKSGLVATHFKSCTKRNPLYIFFGKFENYKTLGKHLLEFACFKSTLKKISDLTGEEIDFTGTKNQSLCSLAVQIGIVDIFKLLEVEPSAVYGDSIGKIAAAYYYENMSLKEAIYVGSNFEEKNFESQVSKKEFGIRKDTLGYEILKKLEDNCLLLNISDKNFNGYDLRFTENTHSVFLETLGRLYEVGYNPQIHKLYPPVEYPVSKSTPMLAPLIQWDHRKNWYTYKFGEQFGENVTQKEHNLSAVLYEDQKYMAGHVIDGRNLVPATKYLYLVWQTFIQSYKLSEVEDLPIIFENCKFIRAVTLPKNGAVKLLVSIQKGSGDFEVVEKNSVVVKGQIFSTKNVESFCTDLPIYQLSENKSEVLEQDEIYRELYLRGYNYSGLFKGISKCNVDATVGLVQWENNWVSFLDNMLQLKILQMDTRLLYVPVGIKRLVINPSQKQNSLSPVYSYKECNVIKSDAVEIQGVQAAAITKKKSVVSPVLEKYVFVPNYFKTDLNQSARIVTQIILENSLESNFKAVEIVDDFTDPKSDYLLPLVSQALDDLPLVAPNLTISSKSSIETLPSINVENFTLSSSSNLLLIIASRIFTRPSLLNLALSALSPDGFLLTREELDFIPETDSVEILTEHVTPNEKCILFKKSQKEENTEFVEVSSNFDWLPKLQKVLKGNSNVGVYSQNREFEGVLGLVNCLRREPGGKKVRLFQIEPNVEYERQLKKQLAVNIFKDGKWGTYRHLLLEEVEKVASENIFVHNTVKGDLSSLKWVQGPLKSETKVEDHSIIIFPYYCGINFKDIMLASGRVSIGSITTDRLEQECPLGFEFSGCDVKGRRFAGMSNNKGTASIVVADKNLVWEVPENWSLEEASTVAVVYCTVLYALFKVAEIKAGMSILIHSGTGGIGLAALNVCLYHCLEVYVTVGTPEKREYLRKYFPQIPDSRIGNSRDTSFEEMIKVETKGRGVNFVLNSLSEEKLRASIRCMAQGGHFLEIGKYDLQSDSSIETLFLERNVSYHGVMLEKIFVNAEDLKIWLLDKMYEGMRLGYVKPLPRTVFQKEEIVEAYKFMTTGKHVGKIVIKLHEEHEHVDSIKDSLFKAYPRFSCDPEKSYIIIGGLGGFGLELADWLYLRGAKKLILVSRTGIQAGYQKQRIKNWTQAGVRVQISTNDTTTYQGCLNLINEAKNLGPIDAIFNLAVVLKDALFEDQTEDSFKTSLAPKAQTTINLDKITREHCPDLRHFVIFSSVSCGRGNSGQTNYGMANSIMERVCEKRKLDGLPGLAIQWGAIGDVGLVAKMQKENKELVIGGTLQQKISSCLEVLDKFLNQNHPVVSSMVVAEKIDKSTALGSAVDAVAYILGIKDIKTVSPHTSFAELGMDSMMGTEMIQTLEKDFEIYITAQEARTLTFARLLELDEEKKSDTATKKVEKCSTEILKYLPTESSSTPVKKLLSQATPKKKCSIFILPGIEGVFKILEPITQNLKTEVFGVEYSNKNESTIQDIAKTILPYVVETVSKEGTFLLVGYSFGVVVATELVLQLEAEGYSGTLVALDGSPAYLTSTARANFPQQDDEEVQITLIFRILSFLIPIDNLSDLKEKFLNCKNFEERIDLGMSLVPPEGEAIQKLSKQAIVALYQRYKALLSYKPTQEKIKSRVVLYKAKTPMLADFAADYQFSQLCQDLKVTELDGDHSTILNDKRLVEDINKLLEVV